MKQKKVNLHASLKSFSRIIAIFLVACLIFSGCSPSANNGEDAPAVENAGSRKIVRIASQGAPQIDPATGSDAASSIALCNIYDTLVFPANDGSSKAWLAESWETSDDGLIWTFYLRKGVKFHSGNEVKASDFVYSYQRLVDIGEGYAYLFTDKVKSVEATDDYTIKITLVSPYGPFLSTLSRIYVLEETLVRDNYADGNYGEHGDYGKTWLTTNDAGSGPYMTEQMLVQESYTATRFDDFWGGWSENAPEAFSIINQSTAATIKTMMASQELEITDQWQTAEAIAALSNMEGIKINTFLQGSLMYMMLNTKAAPTDDIHFRKALTYCLDYKTIVENLFPGSKQPNGPVSSVLAGWNSELPVYEQNLELAREELAQSKYANQLEQLSVELVWISEVADEEKIALLLQSNAAEIGINITIKSVPWTSFADSVSTPETTPCITIVHVDPHYDEAGAVLSSKYHSSSMGTWEQAEWLNNAELDKMIDDAISTIDYDERMEKYCEIQEMVVDLAPSIYLYDMATQCAYQDYITWPAAEASEKGEPFTSVVGYNYYIHDFAYHK